MHRNALRSFLLAHALFLGGPMFLEFSTLALFHGYRKSNLKLFECSQTTETLCRRQNEFEPHQSASSSSCVEKIMGNGDEEIHGHLDENNTRSRIYPSSDLLQGRPIMSPLGQGHRNVPSLHQARISFSPKCANNSSLPVRGRSFMDSPRIPPKWQMS